MNFFTYSYLFWELTNNKFREKNIGNSWRCSKEYMLTYKKTENLEVVGYSEGDLASCVDAKKSTSCYAFTLSPCLVAFKISKLYKIFHHIKSLNVCMKY